MKKILLFIVVAIVICALAACNAPNVPGTTPYTTPGTYNNYVGRGTYGNYMGRGTYGDYTGRNTNGNVGDRYRGYVGKGTVGNNINGTTGRNVVGNNKTGGNIPSNGRATKYVPGGQSYGLRNGRVS